MLVEEAGQFFAFRHPPRVVPHVAAERLPAVLVQADHAVHVPGDADPGDRFDFHAGTATHILPKCLHGLAEGVRPVVGILLQPAPGQAGNVIVLVARLTDAKEDLAVRAPEDRGGPLGTRVDGKHFAARE